ncbi:MAG: hypothetical protein GY711_28230 [bacterium]|nr:hypothetical protein [bacterium]
MRNIAKQLCALSPLALLILGAASAQQVPEAVPGPHAVGTGLWVGGAHTIQHDPHLAGLVAPLVGRVYYPAVSAGPNTPAASGFFQTVFFAHGCPGYAPPGRAFDEFDYLGERLASWGYVMVSLDFSRINSLTCGRHFPGVVARGETMAYAAWAWALTPAQQRPGGVMTSSTNLHMAGHSRGGLGAINAVIGAQQGLYPQYYVGFGKVISISPPDDNIQGSVGNPILCISGAHDGDVGADPLGVYDRQNGRSTFVYLEGANHYGFTDSFSPPGKPTADGVKMRQAAATAAAHFLANGGSGSALVESDVWASPDQLVPRVTYHTPQGTVVDDFETNSSANMTSAGHMVTLGGTLLAREGPAATLSQDPAVRDAWQVADHETSMGVLKWNNSIASWRATFASPLSAGDRLSFRIAKLKRTGNDDSPVSFSVRLHSTSGSASVVSTTRWNGTPEPWLLSARFRRSTLETVSIPVSDFVGIDPSSVTGVELAFDQPGSVSGLIAIDDIKFGY